MVFLLFFYFLIIYYFFLFVLSLVTAIIESLGFGKLEGNFLGSPTVSYIPRKLSLVNQPIETIRIVKDIGSAGSLSLILQALLPYFIFQNQSTSLVLSGGTNVSFSPPIDHVEQVLLPLLSRMGIIAHLSPDFKRGYFPFGGGKIELNIQGSLSFIHPLVCLEQGKIQSIQCVIFGSEYELMDDLKLQLKSLLEEAILQYLNTINHVLDSHFDGIHFQSSSSNQNKSQKKNDKKKSNRKDVSLGVQISLRTTTGNILSANSLICEKDPSIITTFPERISFEILNKIRHLIESGCCVDEQTADQLLIYLALANCNSGSGTGNSNNNSNIVLNSEEKLSSESNEGVVVNLQQQQQHHQQQEIHCSQILCEPFIEGQSSLHLETSIMLLNQILGSRGCNIRMETDTRTECRLITCQGINFSLSSTS